jgi:hypothetical protein
MDHQPDGATVQHSNPAVQAGFTIIPNVVLTARRLSPGSRLLYGLLKMYAWQSGNAYPGQQRLAEEMGVSTRQIRNYQKELEAAGLLRIEQRGLTQTNRYWIEDIPADFLSERKNPSGQEVAVTSGQDRNPVSDKEDSGEKDSERKRAEPSAPPPPVLPERPVIPPGTPVNRRPDAPPVLRAVPKPAPPRETLAHWRPDAECQAWWEEQCREEAIPPGAVDVPLETKKWREAESTQGLKPGQYARYWRMWMLRAIERWRDKPLPASKASPTVTGAPYRVVTARGVAS